MKRFFLGSVSFTVGLIVSACGGSSSSTSAAGKGDICKEQCEELKRCDDSVEVDACTESCTESQLTSKGGQEIITNCIVKQECQSGNGLEILDCIDDEVQNIPPSAEGQAFCGAGLDAQAECSDSEVPDADREQCSDWISLFSDEALVKVNACFEKSCDAMGLCLLSEFADIRAELEANPSGAALAEQLDELIQGFGSSGE